MLNERIRRRIEALNRGPLPVETPVAHPATTGTDASAPAPRPAAVRRSPARPGPVPTLLGLTTRGVVVENAAGTHLRIRLAIDELWPGGEDLVARRLAVCKQGDDELGALISSFPERALLLDLETCGLAGAPLFLIGTLRTIDGRLTVELLLARDYSEEGAVLTTLWQQVGEETVLATFNGKSFDWPMVADRTARYLLFAEERPPTPRHVDLLHHARRRYKGTLPNCKLQTLETHVCGRSRTDDLPGGEIPAAYERFVRTGRTSEIDAILMHNAIDLVTLLDLAVRLA